MADGTGTGTGGAAGGDAGGFLDNLAEKALAVAREIGDAFKTNINPTNIGEIITQLDEQATELVKTFGQGRENIANIKEVLADSVHSVIRLGGEMSDIVKIQQEVSGSLGRNTMLMSDSFDDIYAATQVTQTSASKIIEGFKDVGISAYDASKSIQTVVDTAREIGVSAQAVTSEVLSNMSMLNKYTFQGGVEGLAKMAAQATNLRINISDVSATIEKAFNPESAIDMAASLQRLGVAQSDLLDPLRLMDLAQNDPAELQNQIAEMSKQFVQLNEKGQFEIMPGAKRQLREIEDALGMSQGSLSKMALSSAELGDKMSKIKFPDTFTEEEKTMIANMAEMKDGEYKITLGGDTLGIDEAMEKLKGDDEKMKELLDASKPKSLEDLQKDQLGFTKSIAADIAAIRNRTGYAIASSRDVTKGQTKIKEGSETILGSFDNAALSVKNMRTEVESFTTGISEAVKNNDLGKFSTAAGRLGDYIDKTLMVTFKDLDANINKVFGTNITEQIEKLDKKEVVSGNDVLKLPNKEVQLYEKDTFMAMTNGEQFLKNLEMYKLMQNMPSVTQTNTTTETKNTNETSLNINLSGVPNNMNKEELVGIFKNEILKNTELMRELSKSTKQMETNDYLSVS